MTAWYGPVNGMISENIPGLFFPTSENIFYYYAHKLIEQCGGEMPIIGRSRDIFTILASTTGRRKIPLKFENDCKV